MLCVGCFMLCVPCVMLCVPCVMLCVPCFAVQSTECTCLQFNLNSHNIFYMDVFRTRGFIFSSKYRARCSTYRTASSVAKPHFDAPRCTIHLHVRYTVPALFATVFLKMNPWGSKHAHVKDIVKNEIKQRCTLLVYSVWLLVTRLTIWGSHLSVLSPLPMEVNVRRRYVSLPLHKGLVCAMSDWWRCRAANSTSQCSSGVPRNFVRGRGVQQIQLRTEDRENRDLEAAAP